MRLANEEIFGPVASIFPFTTEEEVVNSANNSDVGLASYVFTQNISRATRISELLQAGMVALNTGVVSDWGTP
jgi:succinate-semialdehyde dehydrogenase / glutarate-semialdehyde dehydrogenase